MVQLLTNSRLTCARTCLRKHFLRYELGMRPDVDSTPQKVGSAFHAAKEAEAKGRDPYVAVRSFELDPYDEAMVLNLIVAHDWYWKHAWAEKPIEPLAAEIAFDLPLTNPETGAPTPVWRRAGKIDLIGRLHDGRLALIEYKTTSEEIDPASDYWTRVRIDQQSTGYFLAARELGVAVETILYDVVRKPMLRPKAIPLLDANGHKIVLDAAGSRVLTKDGKKPRETGDAAAGYVLQTRPETPEEFGDRIRADIGERPEYYFARVDIPRLESDLESFRHELWQQQLSLRAAQRSGHWFRNPSACKNHFGTCEYLGICERADLATFTPSGFVREADVHPELRSPEASPAQPLVGS